ncbi:MAG: GntR family transcriptional regulator [Pseudomonadales bacterium]|jgi:DNA-binding GntR family transcriptional regulator|tara:strand:+ start:4969 stop:5652 length:684 start_codon:yes stop_codon:yes gene_type:complete
MSVVTSISATIAEKLEMSILLGQRRLGDRLDERELAEHFKVSRTPIREALQRLSAVGLVHTNGRKGTNVARLTMPQLLDSFLVVSELEALAATQASKRITKEQVSTLWTHQKDCEKAFSANNPDAFCIANDLLHGTILKVSGNWMLQDYMRRTLILAPYRRHITFQPGRMEASIEEHESFIRAIESGNGLAAATCMRGHVNALADGLSDFLYFLDQTGLSEIIASKE